MREHPNSVEIALDQGVGLGDFQSHWANDKGEADPHVLTALASGDIDALVVALAPTRLFIALVAQTTGEPGEGDKHSYMSVACLLASDGRLGLLCFTGIDALTQWNPDARPVPMAAPDAAEAALDENAQGIIVDLGGAHSATLVLADIVKLSAKDQRDRAVLLLRERFAELEEHIVFEHRKDGVLQVEVPERLMEKVKKFVQTDPALHSFAPAGVAICAKGPVEVV
jgi:hypothetical protein